MQKNNELESKFNKLSEDLTKRLETMETDVKESLNKIVHEVPEKIKTANQNWAQTAMKNQSPTDFKQILKEAREEQKKEDSERESKENNIIIYWVAESEKPVVEEKKEEDENFFEELCSDILEIPDIKFQKVVRVGPKTDKEGEPRKTPRPLKVVMEDKESKTVLMRNLYKLRSAEERFSQISVTHDYSKEEREKIKVKVAEAQRKNEEEQPKNFRYRVRGPPWDLQIKKIKTAEQE